jgi:hypothetical protein
MEKRFESSRRTFLKSAAFLGGVAALLGLTKRVSSEPVQAKPLEDKSDQGYQLTEHVKRYYETARL